jgi:hypothetical protein
MSNETAVFKKSPYHEALSEKFTTELKDGSAVLLQPTAKNARGLDYNANTGKEFTGMNQVLAMTVAQEKGYGEGGWLTLKQAGDKGGKVAAGEEGLKLQQWRTTKSVVARDNDGEVIKNPRTGLTAFKTVQLEKPELFTVTYFNQAQIENLPKSAPPMKPDVYNQAYAKRAMQDFPQNTLEGVMASQIVARKNGLEYTPDPKQAPALAKQLEKGGTEIFKAAKGANQLVNQVTQNAEKNYGTIMANAAKEVEQGSEGKKTASKKSPSSSAKKPVAKKPVAKKSAAKKPAAKKVAANKSAAKKPAKKKEIER